MSLEKKYLALYRQYRPKTFEQVQGQQHIIETLKNVIRENKIGHAYLFCGPHGNGKTSTAKIFANAINCQHRINESPCEQCILSVDKNMDIIEIDAASNTGIDDIRELREKIKHLPTNGKYKIYIIDEVHMLSKGAFNALLKTIEEPPKHVIFILATTDPQKIPLTILSRVQRFNFKKIDKQILENQLDYIFERENIQADKDAIKLLVNLGNGSFRDTLSIADQISIYCSNKVITTKEIEELFGIVDFENIWFLLKCIHNSDSKLLINKFNHLVDNGASVEKIISQLFTTLKDYVIYKKTDDQTLLEYATVDKILELDIDDKILFEYIEIVQSAINESQYSDIPKEIIELYLLKMASINKKEHKSSIIDHDNINSIIEEKEIEHTKLNNESAEDFQLVNETILNEEKNTSDNHDKFNSIFNLANISNSYETEDEIQINKIKEELEQSGIKEINIDNILEKTSEILIAETTSEYENNDLLNDIITTEFSNEVSLSKTVDIIKPELEQEDVNKLAFIYQYIKMGLYNYKGTSKLDLDTMYYSILEQRIKKEYSNLISLLTGFKIFFSINELIVLRSDDILKVHQLNLKRSDDDFIEAINSIFGRYTNIVAISKEQMEMAIQNCKLNWISKKNEEIKMISLPSLEKYKNKVSPNVEYAKKLFGDIVKEPKK